MEKKGHIVRACRRKLAKSKHYASTARSEHRQEWDKEPLECRLNFIEPAERVEVQVNGIAIGMEVDTAAACSVIDPRTMHSLKITKHKLRQAEITLRT